mmetsp:Transcript_101674/g.283039  ORF Transcript_101674/g.283039 Transcript_101674/m.283039 type:complete len:215 (-) Transcript_101674:68-712(-)
MLLCLQLGELLLQRLDLRLLAGNLPLVLALLVLDGTVRQTGARWRHWHGHHRRPEKPQGRHEQGRPKQWRGEHGADANGDSGTPGDAWPGARERLGPHRRRPRAAPPQAKAAHAAAAARRLRVAGRHQRHEERCTEGQRHAPSASRGCRLGRLLGDARRLGRVYCLLHVLVHGLVTPWQWRLHKGPVCKYHRCQEGTARQSATACKELHEASTT